MTREPEPTGPHPLLRVTGRLYVAELRSELPCMDVRDGRFALDWASPWLPAGAVYVKPIEFDAGFGRAQLLHVPGGVDASVWPTRYTPTPGGGRKFMLGWESRDHDTRIVCRRVKPVDWPINFLSEDSWTMFMAAEPIASGEAA